MQNTNPAISRLEQLLNTHDLDLDNVARGKVGRFTAAYIKAVLAGEREATAHTLEQIGFAITATARRREAGARLSTAEGLDTDLLGCAVAKSLWEYEPPGDDDGEDHLLLVLRTEITRRDDLTDKQKMHALMLAISYLTSTLNGRYRGRDGYLYNISVEESLKLAGLGEVATA